VIRIQVMPAGSGSGIGRFYARDEAAPLEDYLLLFMLNWEIGSNEVWVHGMMGTSSRKALRELLIELRARGFEYIRALRQEHRILPRATPHPDGRGLVLKISDFMGEIDPNASGFVAL
jgi:hypothetical protein